jgi:hypothetical protein
VLEDGQRVGATIELVMLPSGFARPLRNCAVPKHVHPPGTDPLGYTSIFGGGSDVVKSKSQSNQLKAGAVPPPCGCALVALLAGLLSAGDDPRR